MSRSVSRRSSEESTSNIEKRKCVYRRIAKVVAWIHLVFSGAHILLLLWQCTELETNAPVEDIVQNLMAKENINYQYTDDERTQMTIGFLVLEIMGNATIFFIGLSLLNGIRKDSISTTKICLMILCVLMLIYGAFFVNEISHYKGESSTIFNGAFVLFQLIANICIALYLRQLYKSRPSRISTQHAFPSISTSSDLAII